MNEWIDHPLLKDMDPAKAELFRRAAKQVSGKSGKDMAPIMLALITSANRQDIRFTPEEMDLILTVLKEGKPPEEQAQIDRTVQMVKTLIRTNMK